MSTSQTACRRAVMASQEVVLENCEGVDGSVEEVSDDVFVFVPGAAQREFAHDLQDDLTDRQREAAIESCVESDWVRNVAETLVGDGAGRAARESTRRSVCERLFD